jgi:hypothetical protein
MLIGITGRKRAGKNTIADGICAAFPQARQFAFAGELKRICREVWGLTEEQTDGKSKEVEFAVPVFMDDRIRLAEAELGFALPRLDLVANTPREILQFFGTEYVRSVNEHYWVDFVLNQTAGEPLALVTDVRFPNEASAIKGSGGWLIRVIRPGLSAADTHASEIHIDTLEVDFSFMNVTTPAQLKSRAALFVQFILDYYAAAER